MKFAYPINLAFTKCTTMNVIFTVDVTSSSLKRPMIDQMDIFKKYPYFSV
jgi:hypothetical protein